MINLTSSAVIHRTVRQVFDFVSIPENDFRWHYGTLAASRLAEGSPSQGTFFRSIGHVLGRRNLSTFEVTEYEPNRKYGFKSLTGPLHSKTSYILKSVSGRTRINISIQASAPNFFQLNEARLRKTMEKQLKEDVARLKDILETNTTDFRDNQDAIKK